jgi:hypothetical protein
VAVPPLTWTGKLLVFWALLTIGVLLVVTRFLTALAMALEAAFLSVRRRGLNAVELTEMVPIPVAGFD